MVYPPSDIAQLNGTGLPQDPLAQFLPPPTVEEVLQEQGLLPSASQVGKALETKWRATSNVRDRMLKDYDLYTLKKYEPGITDSVDPEDAYTTNAPRVMAEKIIAFISSTSPIIRANSDEAQEAQEEQNDRVEQFAIGTVENINRRRRRQGDQAVIDEMAWYSVVRGRYVAARAYLSKDEYGQTEEDILPLDPYNLVIQPGKDELLWAGYRMSLTVQEILDEYPDYKFEEDVEMLADDEMRDVWEYYCRKPNPFHDPFSPDPFDRHPYVYLAGILIDDQWAKEPFNLYMLNFPVVLSPVGATPIVTHHEGGRTEGTEHVEEEAFGESIFAENRLIWDQFNRSMSYAQDLMAKASDPPQNVLSLDGTKTMEEGSMEKGAQRSLSVANSEAIEIAETPDASRVAMLFLQQLQQESIAGGLPPQAFGMLDKPLSSVALRQLGNNLEHRVSPRMRAVAACLEGCLENMIAQFETGGFEPITVSGRRFDNQRFANRVITPEGIYGHDPVGVKMALALPEDESTKWQVAMMAMQPTAAGEPLASLEWVRENMLNMESAKLLTRQNRESAGVMQDPLASALQQFTAYVRDGDKANAMIWYDRLEVLSLQRQAEGSMLKAQIAQLAQQIGMQPQGPPMDPLNAGLTTGAGSTIDQGLGIGQTLRGPNSTGLNPAFGSTPQTEFTGVGNQPSPEAGYNTTAPRQRDTGLLGPDGNPINAG